jgi:predicted O-methyltransferase YrrM
MSNLFFELDHSKKPIKINFNTRSNIILDKNIFTKYDDYFSKINLIKLDNYILRVLDFKKEFIYKFFNISISSIKKKAILNGDYINGELIINISVNSLLNNDKQKNIKNIKNIKDINLDKKFDYIFLDKFSTKLLDKIKNLKYEEKQTFLYKYFLTLISYFFDILEEKGSVFIIFYNYNEAATIEILYLLSCLFEKITIYEGNNIYCSNFLYKKSTIDQEDFKRILSKNNYIIEPKHNIKELIKYLENCYINENNKYNLLINNKIDEYIDLEFNDIYNSILFLYKDKDKILHYYKQILHFFKRIILENKIIKIHSSIGDKEGQYINFIIEKYKSKKCLEIGMAFGISAFYILSNLNTTLISIDPFQKIQWNNNGIKLLKEFGYEKRHKCILKKSYEALPEILKKEGEKSFDFIFIDGWHTFDYTLIDFFYANLLLKVNSIIVIDDALHPGVKKCINYLDSNYKFYEKLDSPKTLACYLKIKDDDREWNFHQFF